MKLTMFMIVCTALLLLPFVPALQEWRRPTDVAALPIPQEAGSDAYYLPRLARAGHPFPELLQSESDIQCAQGSTHLALMANGQIVVQPNGRIVEWAHADGALRLEPGSVGLRRLTAGALIELDRDCCFERLHAPVIRLGANAATGPCAHEEPTQECGQPALRQWSELPGAQRRSESSFRFDGDCDVSGPGCYEGSLVVTGVLRVESGVVVRGDLKARRGIVIGPDARIAGSVISECDIHLLDGARVDGPVISERAVFLSPRVRIGSPGELTTMSAPVIVSQSGVVAHGTVWAHQMGVVWSPV